MLASSRIRLRGLDLGSRHELLAEATGLDESILKTLRPEDGLSFEQADHMIENAVGIFGIPIGIACNFTIKAEFLSSASDHAERVMLSYGQQRQAAAQARAGCTVELVPLRDLRVVSKADGAAGLARATSYRFSAQGRI